MNRINRKEQKSREEHIEDVLEKLKTDLPSFQIAIQKKTRQYKNAQAFKINKTRISKTFSGKKN